MSDSLSNASHSQRAQAFPDVETSISRPRVARPRLPPPSLSPPCLLDLVLRPLQEHPGEGENEEVDREAVMDRICAGNAVNRERAQRSTLQSLSPLPNAVFTGALYWSTQLTVKNPQRCPRTRSHRQLCQHLGCKWIFSCFPCHHSLIPRTEEQVADAQAPHHSRHDDKELADESQDRHAVVPLLDVRPELGDAVMQPASRTRVARPRISQLPLLVFVGP